MSRRKTSLPSRSLPSGSVERFRSTRPASANATTSGGDIRKFALMFWCTRASKFRFPLSTDAAIKSCVVIASSIFGCSGPEFPMHVVQPYPTIWKPS